MFAPNLTLTVTIEAGPAGDPELHLHPGGQGFWIAQMVSRLGEPVVLVGPAGGEPGRVVRTLVQARGIELDSTGMAAPTPSYVHDRRSGERTEIVRTGPPTLDRHEVDDLFGTILARAIDSGLVVLTGAEAPAVPHDTFRRLGADLGAVGVPVVADMHGPSLDALLTGGPVRLLKVSDEDLMAAGLLDRRDERSVRNAVESLHARGAESVVVSRAGTDDVALLRGRWYVARATHLEAMDHRGSGDSMTAALAVGSLRGLPDDELLRLACAAGAANVTRHGLGSSDVDLVASLTTFVDVQHVDAR